MLILSLVSQARFHNQLLLNFETEAKSLRPKPKGPEATAEAEGYEPKTEAEAKHFCLEALTSLVFTSL